MNDSVRFPNEAEAIRQLGGVVIMIKRPGTKPAKFNWGKIGEFLYDKFTAYVEDWGTKTPHNKKATLDVTLAVTGPVALS